MSQSIYVPDCENFLQGRCPKSDVRLMAEHGPPQAAYYWTFGCRTCKGMFFKWNASMVAKAKRGELDRELGNLMGGDKRFAGMGEDALQHRVKGVAGR